MSAIWTRLATYFFGVDMMVPQPITRYEHLLADIVGDGANVTFALTTRIEKYLAKIAGKNVKIPTPITRAEMYLAAIAGMDVDIPSPITRAEMYLAAIAGMDVDIPSPITRAEMYLAAWADKTGTIEKTASGTLVHIDDAVSAPVKRLIVNVAPLQDLHGYNHPWIGGAGKNLLKDFVGNPDIVKIGNLTLTKQSDGSIVLNGTVTENVEYYLAQRSRPEKNFILPEGSYILSGIPKGYESADLRLGYNRGSKSATIGKDVGSGVAITDNGEGLRYGVWLGVRSGTFDNVVVKPMIRRADTDSDFEPYENICPISGWDGANIYVSPTRDATDGSTYLVKFPGEAGTVYGGTLDVISGLLTVKKILIEPKSTNSWVNQGNCARYPLSARIINSRLSDSICSHFLFNQTHIGWAEIEYGEYLIADNNIGFGGFTKDTIGEYLDEQEANGNPVRVVAKLVTPITYQLTPHEIRTLRGTNDIWSSVGDIEITYLAKNS